MAKKITPKEYADMRGITFQHVHNYIRDNKRLPGVKNVLKYSRFYLLEVDEKKIIAKPAKRLRKKAKKDLVVSKQ